ncbi:MAG: hypothetical protein HZB16_24505, partial [Armatimonadetes bacterium]|nr:hypothetical protein [Armatimonadota bacterium]
MSPYEVIEAEQAERPDLIGPTMQLALTSRDHRLRWAALTFLPKSAMDQPEWAAFVAAATVDRSPLLRYNALEAIVRLRWQALADCVPPR